MRRLFAAAAAAVLLSASAPLSASASSTVARPLPGAVFAQPPFPVYAAQGAAKTASWLQFGYDAGHSGFNPLESTLTEKNVAGLQVAWNDQSIIQPSGIVVDGSVAYVTDVNQTNEGLYALDAASGKQKWYTPIGLNSVGSTGHAVSAVSGNVVISACTNQNPNNLQSGLCGFNAKNGKMAWSYMCTPYPPSQNGPCSGIQQGSVPSVSGKLVYAQIVQGVNEQPDTEALNAKTGAVAWDVPGIYHCPDGGAGSDFALPVANGNVYAVLACQGSQGATIVCALNAASGATSWCVASESIYVNDMVAGEGKVFVAEPVNSGTNLVALNAKTGAVAWSASLPGANFERLAVADKRVFINQGGNVYALSAKNGAPLWSNTSNVNIAAGSVLSVANGIVYTNGFGGNNGDAAITALDEKTGALVWTSSPVGNGASPATPVILDGTVYAGCYTMCSFTLPPGLRRR